MRLMQAIVGSAAVAAVLAECPVEASQAGDSWATVGEWKLDPIRGGACFLTRKYSSGTYLHLTRLDGRAQLSVGNRNFNPFVAGSYGLIPIVAGKRRPFARGGNVQSYNAGLSLSAGPELLVELGAATTLEVHSPKGILLERLDLLGLGNALARVPECIERAAAIPNSGRIYAPPAPPPPPSRRGGLRPARARAQLHLLFSSDDYPSAAVRAGEEGAVGFQLDVGRNGAVAACRIVASSGSAVLDSTTCRLLTMRARFDPARDHKGKPVDDRVSGRIVWRLPEPEPEPEPPPPPS